VLTPNGDGFNDDWVIGGLEFFPTALVQVYNRWGQLLFESRGYNQRWDGTWNGRLVSVADYYYVITYDVNRDPLTGTVTVKY
jgi:gliding motility-associated-like protein